MISQKCPVCRSSRIRRGYRPTPIWKRIAFRYNLLCDNCNLEFVGFALPGFISPKQTNSSKRRKENGDNVKRRTSRLRTQTPQVDASKDLPEPIQPRLKKKVRVKY